MKRIFIAIKVEPKETLLNLFSFLQSRTDRDSIKWTKVDNVHITLAFLGDTAENIIKQIIEMLNKICIDFSPFELNMKGTGVFRSYSDPQIIWTGIEHSDRLIQLNKLILNGLKNLNIDLDDKPFNPHLTMGRIKHLNDRDSFKSLMQEFQNTEIQKIPVNEVVLFESILLPAGPLYKPIIKIVL
jgi:2'-5' RNA ligase